MNRENDMELVAATLAHEIKNPLSMVMAGIELLELQEYKEEDNIIRTCHTMRRELDKALYILQTFVECQKPPHIIDKVNVDIADLVRDVCEDANKTIGANVEIECHEFGRFPLHVDDLKLSQVFLNIIKNAIEANATKISVKVYETQNYVVIKCSDNGEGISASSLAHIGEPFFTTKKHGTGLGLSFCKAIIESHGGFFNLKNRQQGGCNAIVKLPKE